MRRRFAWIAVLVLLLLPLPGRWGIFTQILPIAAVSWIYWRRGAGLDGAGLGNPRGGWARCVLTALWLASLLYAVEAVTIRPLAGLVFPQPKDLSLFEPIKGDLTTLLVFLGFMWVTAAFGEEYVWRGFVLRELAGEHRRNGPALVASALLFGMAHAYQGPRGVAEAVGGGLLLGIVYLSSGRSSVWLVALVHGVQNTISFVAIYFDVYDKIHFLSS
jgi:membrane protease YdiL (CAAX protease family)